MDRRRIGWITMVAGALLVLGSMATQPTANAGTLPTTRLELHNATARVGSDCPAGGGAYWHFVLAPNNGDWEFVEITLNLAGTTHTFSGAQIVPNGSQMDNVFVAVPDGHVLSDLDDDGSSALVTPEVPIDKKGEFKVSFVLSHLCEGTTSTTTTTVEEETTTTVEDETTTTVEDETTTTVEDETTTTVEDETTTTLSEETTTTEGDIDESTTTTESESQNPTTTTISESLPPTGSDGSTLLVLGLMAIGFGIVSATLGRPVVER